MQAKVVPDRTLRLRIEREVAKSVREHFIIFTDADRTIQNLAVGSP